MNEPRIKALTFDVFGTVVDWRGSIVRLGEAFASKRGLGEIDWESLVRDWRAGYGPAMNQVRLGEIPWANIDALHRQILQGLLPVYGLEQLSESDRDEMNLFWHKLDPWPDAIPGLVRLRTRCTLATLSNGNIALLTNMAKYSGLPWDCILSSELFGCYKPDAEVYTGAARLLGVDTREVLMVAAHKSDLEGAARTGMMTAFVPRPAEYGETPSEELTAEPWMDYVAADFSELASLLGV